MSDKEIRDFNGDILTNGDWVFVTTYDGGILKYFLLKYLNTSSRNSYYYFEDLDNNMAHLDFNHDKTSLTKLTTEDLVKHKLGCKFKKFEGWSK